MFKAWMVLPALFWGAVVMPSAAEWLRTRGAQARPQVIVHVAAPVAPQAPEPPETRVQERTQELDPGATCELEQVSGDIVVTPAAGRVARLRVEIEDDDAAAVRVEITGDRKGLKARAVYGGCDHGDAHNAAQQEVRYVLELPAQVNLHVKTVSGDVHVTGADAGLQVHAISGEVHLDQVRGDPSIETVSGDIHLEEVGGRLQVVTVSGDVDADLSAGLKSGDLHSVSGEMNLAAPRNTPINLRAVTMSGEVENEFASAGSILLRVQTVSGDIHLGRR